MLDSVELVKVHHFSSQDKSKRRKMMFLFAGHINHTQASSNQPLDCS
jgi:hypothetical protein